MEGRTMNRVDMIRRRHRAYRSPQQRPELALGELVKVIHLNEIGRVVGMSRAGAQVEIGQWTGVVPYSGLMLLTGVPSPCVGQAATPRMSM